MELHHYACSLVKAFRHDCELDICIVWKYITAVTVRNTYPPSFDHTSPPVDTGTVSWIKPVPRLATFPTPWLLVCSGKPHIERPLTLFYGTRV